MTLLLFAATFGSLSWTEQKDKVAYIAEKNPPKTAPFYQQKAKTDSSSDMKESLIVVPTFIFIIRISHSRMLTLLTNQTFRRNQMQKKK